MVTLKYTDTDRLQRKLRGRLQLYETESTSIYPTGLPNQKVDIDLVYDIAEDKEDFVDAVLEQLYVLPLKKHHPIVRNIIENLTISDVLKVHFQGGASFSQDASNSIGELASQAYWYLTLLTANTGIVLPYTAQQPAGMPSSIPARRLLLDGETEAWQHPGTITVNNHMVIGRVVAYSHAFEAGYLFENPRALGSNWLLPDKCSRHPDQCCIRCEVVPCRCKP